jgi:hypothetical protein
MMIVQAVRVKSKYLDTARALAVRRKVIDSSKNTNKNTRLSLSF